jgi:hypothetical protein
MLKRKEEKKLCEINKKEKVTRTKVMQVKLFMSK